MTNPGMRRSSVAIVGAGAAGLMVAARLLDQATARNLPLDVRLIDSTEPGRGVAYSTTSPSHLLNVPAGRMSAEPGNVEDFVQWLNRNYEPEVGPGDFAQRRQFGRYLGEYLALVAQRTAAGPARLHRVIDRATELNTEAGGVRVRLAGGDQLTADAAVIATGSSAPNCDWAPEALLRSDRFVADPWSPGVLDELPAGDVLLVGTGLTMVDMALQLGGNGRVLHAISRRGLLPYPHATEVKPPRLPAGIPDSEDLAVLRAAVLAHLKNGLRQDRDWRPAFDGLRIVTTDLWTRLSEADRAEFVALDARQWEVRRHRIPPRSAAAIAELRAAGALRVVGAHLAEATEDAEGLLVRLSTGEQLRVGAVINCTGNRMDVTEVADPLVVSLLAAGLARPGPLGLGIDADSEGRVRSASGGRGNPLWTVGPLRRGTLWETTAFPEIRSQSGELAEQLMTELAAKRERDRPRQPRPRDDYSLPLSATPEAAEAYRQALGKILCVQSGAEALLAQAVAADPTFALGHAAMAVLGHEREDRFASRASLRLALRAAARHGDDRERGFVHAVAALINGSADGEAALLRHIEDNPRDAFAVSIAVPTIAFAGVTHGEAGQQLIERLGPDYGSDWWYTGQLAFVRQEQSRWEEAEDLASRALAEQPGSGHAVHARTHVFYETGHHQAGLDWLDGWLAELGPEANNRAHFSWHAALHELAMGDQAAVRDRYLSQLAPPGVAGSRALVDSASLLWRCLVTDTWAGTVPINPVLDAAPPQWLSRPPNTFAALHSAIALSAAGDLGGLDSLRRFAANHRLPVFGAIVAPLCAGLAAVIQEEWSAAVEHLSAVVPIPVECGGSAAQREVVEDTLIHAMMRAGRCTEAAQLLSQRLDRRESALDARRLVGLENG
jgi:uncharacterized NAD(P)/FAD-binding protein YdhS